MEVVKLIFNWRQVGSTIDRDGAGEDYSSYTVGKDGVVYIEENEPSGGLEQWNYLVEMNDGRRFRVFNPNHVEYIAPKEVCSIIP